MSVLTLIFGLLSGCFLSVLVGIILLSVMLPLMHIMSAIG